MPYIDLNNVGRKVAYEEYGDPFGFPILVQHGLIASIKDGDLFDLLVRNGARVICIARPGYGESAPFEMKNIGEWGKVVGRLVGTLDLERFDVLGMSSGAPYAYSVAHHLVDQARYVYIFSGIPAMYEDEVLAKWPFPVKKNVSIEEMQNLANDLFFSNLSEGDLLRNDIRDSIANDGFGLALDFRLRCMDWGFRLNQIRQKVFMRHARLDKSVPFECAKMTADILENCELLVDEGDIHFSTDSLDFFLKRTVVKNLP